MSQCHQILLALKCGERLTALSALKRYGVLRLAARVDDLRNSGHRIKTKMVKDGRKRYAEYSL